MVHDSDSVIRLIDKKVSVVGMSMVMVVSFMRILTLMIIMMPIINMVQEGHKKRVRSCPAEVPKESSK